MATRIGGKEMRSKNLSLKIKIFEKGITQRTLSKKIGIPESMLSMLINGKYIPTDQEKKKIADALECKREELFEDDLLHASEAVQT